MVIEVDDVLHYSNFSTVSILERPQGFVWTLKLFALTLCHQIGGLLIVYARYAMLRHP